jgi:hypothetical protein
VGKGALKSVSPRGQNRARAVPTRLKHDSDFSHPTISHRPAQPGDPISCDAQ